MIAACLATLVGATTSAQDAAPEVAKPAPARQSEPAKLPASDESADGAVEAYLEHHNLRSVLALQLRSRLDRTTGEARAELVERLGKLYVQLLSETSNPEERLLIEDRSRELLRLAPDADSYELRINLAKATYLKAEQLAESDRLRLASEDDRREAERILRSVLPVFREIGLKVNQRVTGLEHREQVAGDAEARTVREKLAESRRLRSLAMYYAGWSGYYLSLMTGDARAAAQAMEDFGWLLNAGAGKQANLEKLPRNMLKYEHIARAAMGAGLCAAAAGDDVAAVRWLDAVGEAEEVPDAVRTQLFTRRIAVLGRGARWADLRNEVRRFRTGTTDGTLQPLEVNDARLLAIVCYEGKGGADKGSSAIEEIETLTQVAFSDLIARGEAGHVLDLVRRYGSAPIGEEGFIVHYVRGLQSYERARAAHKASGTPEDDPPSDAAVANIYRESAKTLEQAVGSRDAGTFKSDFGRAWLKLGLCWYYAGDFDKAAETFTRGIDAGIADDQRREALWFSIVALDKAVETGKPRSEDRDRASAQYLKEYPTSDQAAQLLLRTSGRRLLAAEEGIKRLLAVEPGSPLYPSARRQASNMLFELFRGARGAERAPAAARFVEVGIRVLDADAQTAMSGDSAEAQQAAGVAIQRARQIADALLACQPPDTSRAASVLATLEAVASRRSLEIGGLGEELAYRRMQIAIETGDSETAERNADLLRRGSGPFAQAAEVLLYDRAADRVRRSPEDMALARELVRAGARLLTRIKDSNKAAADSVRNAMADAATRVQLAERDAQMLELALQLDKELVAGGVNAAPILRRYATNLEAGGQLRPAYEVWVMLLNSLDPSTEDWLEIRYRSLLAQSRFDPASASGTLRQYKLLHPDFGPDPWGGKLRELDESITSLSTPAPGAGGGP
jgi:tetratricopeptide (TPR) repeat protein